MRERRVVVGGAAGLQRDDLPVRINGTDPTFRIGADHLGEALPRVEAPRVLDLIDIASAVFAADSSLRRGASSRPDLGAGWYRHLRFVIGVRDRQFWMRQDVDEALCEAISFLTGDQVSFDFVQSTDPRSIPESLLSGLAPWGEIAEEVILFSGGLDSLTGALETLALGSGRVVLVTHRSAPKIMGLQDDLVAELARRFPRRVTWQAVRATLVGREAVETTQRSRSFFFAALGLLAARSAGARRVRFFENGIVSLNLPIRRQIVGTMATRTTHPLGLHRLGTLMSLVAGEDFTVDNPFAWLTKTEVMERLKTYGGADLVSRTVSCSSIRDRTRLHTHCGGCSQCLDRRFAMLSAGLADVDPVEMYETELLEGPRETGRDRTMALDWTSHAEALAGMDERWFMDRFGAELIDLAAGFPERVSREVVADALALHRRHGQAVQGVLQSSLAARAPALLQRQLPATSLLRMIVAERAGAAILPDLRQRPPLPTAEPEPVAEADAATPSIFPLRVSLAIAHEARPIVTVHGLGSVEGAPAKVVGRLKPQHDEDLAEGLAPEDHRFVLSATLSAASKEAAAQNVKRCRDLLAEYFEAIEGHPPPKPLLIENRRQKGYRLDPHCRFVD